MHRAVSKKRRTTIGQWKKVIARTCCFVTLFAGLAPLSLLPQAAFADNGTNSPDTFRVFVGGFFADLDTTTEVTSSSLGGNTVDLESDLGLENDKVILVGGLRWRFAKRHTLGAQHIALDRDADETLTRDVQIGDDIFTINTLTTTTFDYRATQIDYRYAVWQNEQLDLGVLIGVSDISFDLDVTGDVTGPGGGTVTRRVREDESFPVPSIGLGFRYKFSADWLLRGGITYFEYEKDDDWEASLLIGGLGVEWYPWRHVGLGLGYDFVEADYDEDDRKSDQFDVDFEYSGIQLRVIGRF